MESFSVYATLKGQTVYDYNSITVDPPIEELAVEFRPMFLILTVCSCIMQLHPYEKLQNTTIKFTI